MQNLNLLRQSFIEPDWPAPAKIVALTSTRLGGVSQEGFNGFNLAEHVGDEPDRVAVNRQLLAKGLDKSLRFQWLSQVHGTGVVEVGVEEVQVQADASFCRIPAVACCVLTADCLPILLTTTDGDVVAAVHAGWRGLAAGVVEKTLQAMQVDSEKVLAWLGPAIGPCHFEVGSEVRDAFLATVAVDQQEQFDHLGFEVKNKPDNTGNPDRFDTKYMANLYGISQLKLQQLGVTRIFGGNVCTFCDEQQFYSYRRQSVTGRMVTLIYIRS